MGDERAATIGYFSRFASGLVACAVVAATLHVEVAAAVMLATVMLLALRATYLILRGVL
jgi:hypothetical protein